MGDLPTERININTRSFIVTGVDLSGPFNIKNRNQRSIQLKPSDPIAIGIRGFFVCPLQTPSSPYFLQRA